jgi:hypothetical protein
LNRSEVEKRDAFSSSSSIARMRTIISVANAIGHFNPRNRVFAWIGKFAGHQKSGIAAILTLSE